MLVASRDTCVWRHWCLITTRWLLDSTGEITRHSSLLLLFDPITSDNNANDLLSLCSAGQSNPTFLIQTSSSSYVLRKKPPGELLPGAHKVSFCFFCFFTVNCTCWFLNPITVATIFKDMKYKIARTFCKLLWMFSLCPAGGSKTSPF